MKTYPCPLDETTPVLEFPFGEDSQTHALIAYTEHGGVIMLDSNIRDQPWCSEHHINAIWAIQKLKELEEFEAVKLLLDRGIV